MGVTIANDSVLVRDGEPTTLALDGGTVVLSPRAGFYFDLSPVAGEIWSMLGEPCRVGEMLYTLAQEYDVEAQTLSCEVTAFLEALVEQRLARVLAGNEPQ
jgi:coenzyme PQQ synthesis protein D (PqqD)